MKSSKQLLIPQEHEPFSLSLLDRPRLLADFASNQYSPYPNQFLREFVKQHSSTSGEYAVNPLPENLVAGKNTYVYDAHTYHTKVPPEAIAHLIEHYTKPGDIVLDPFCGSGMTGVAALRCQRKPVLIDLSPAATFITMNFLTPVDERRYQSAVEKVLASTYDEEIALYGTHCRHCNRLVPLEYMVWSYGLICEFCHEEFVLWDVARDERGSVRESKIKSEFECPHCGKLLRKRKLQRTNLYPVQVGYRCCNSGLQESKAVPDEYDLGVIRSNNTGLPDNLWYPTERMPAGINTRQAIAHGLESIDALYTKRNLRAMARLWDIACRWRDKEMSLKLMFTVTSLYQRVTRLSEFRFWGGSGNTANYNVPMIFNEQNVFKVFNRKAKTIRSYFVTCTQKADIPFCVSTQSATELHAIPDNSIDYIFTDPPFGSNINYSEMNYLWEAWLGVFTNTRDEAIINRVQHKKITHYQELMTQALAEMLRVLKPNRWLTLVFHNSSSEVWSVLQKAISLSGFRVLKSQTLDKRHGTFKQFVSENAVGYDLILHCKKLSGNELDNNINNKSLSSYALIREFLERTLKPSLDEFIVRYLHVKRQNELDSRKLYSLWLKERMEAEQIVDLDYEQFRQITNQFVQDEFGDGWDLRAE